MNRRQFTRVRTSIPVDVVFASRTIDATSNDIGLNGLFVSADAEVADDSPCQVVLHLGGRGEGVIVRATGRVVRSLVGGFAIHFTELIDLESNEYLRNLILYNAADPAAVGAELESHVGLKPIGQSPPPTD